MGEEGQPAVKAASGLWGETCLPAQGKKSQEGGGRTPATLGRGSSGMGGGGEQVELLEKSMELRKATERLKGLGAS